jgi:phosphoglycerol transferase MdoB-like AlkP superfamily enzyme
MNKKQDIAFMSNSEADENFNKLYSEKDEKSVEKLIKGDNPNIIIFILESFTANVIEELGGEKEATPNLNKLSHEGVFFKNFYASGDRSDKGIISILSGYPAQPTTSIIKYIKKTEKLPYLSKELEKNNYFTGFYYGGDLNFANMNSYFISGGYDTLVTIKNYPKSELNSKWGAHDHFTFQRIFDDINKTKTPFFRVMFTLSSHEPFDVPHTSQFNGDSDGDKFLNSIHYTDSCLGDFIKKAKLTEWWSNTWIIFVADHGSRLPNNIPYSSPAKFKIPMLWIGGAVTKDTVINRLSSQIDIPLMIGNQLNKNFKGFNFSKDILDKTQNDFAFFAYNNGFGFYTSDSSGYVWDNIANNYVINNNASKDVVTEGKAFMQTLLNNFNNK